MSSWNIEDLNGYKPITTFWEDFSVADTFGEDAIRETYKRVFDEWKSDYKFLTELVLVLNHKIWEHYENNWIVANVYEELWQETDEYAMDNLTGDDLLYFLLTTD